MEQHFARIDSLSHRYFLSPLGIECKTLVGEIGKALRQGGYSERRTNAVKVLRYIDGRVEVECVEMLYDHFSLRAVRPQGYFCHLAGDVVMAQTSVKDSALAFDHATAEISDEGVAVWLSDMGEVKSIDGASVVAVFDDEIRFSHSGSGVEFELAYVAVQGGKRAVSRGEISHEDMLRAKEVFYIDHRGVTALLSCSGHFYMDIVAERTARQMAEAEG